jgi:magnesium chelatase family protein
LLDRIDLQIVLPPVELSHLQGHERGESSAVVRARVIATRNIQAERRARGEVIAATNADLGVRDLERVATLDARGASVLAAAVERLGMSARAYGKVLRVARTLADMEGGGPIRPGHVAEAVHARLLDREPPPGGAAPAAAIAA